MQVTKEITFDMAHLLSNYNGKCRNLHGHTYRLQVTVEMEVNDISCMAVDFGFLKEVLENVVTDRFDHAICFSSEDYRSSAEDELLAWADIHSMNYVIIPNGKTTCEMLAPYIKELIIEEFKDNGVKN